MLFKLSVKNFKKSIQDYFIYFFTLILGIAVFYIFNAIETQTAMMEVTKTKAEIIHMMNGVLEGVSLVISFILGYLIVYASRFMLKKRKKEFGIYLTLGMGKRQVAMILWMETIFMGLISLAAGLGAGIGLSQFMSLLVSNLFQADMSRFVFVVSGKAVGKSVLYFLVIYLVVMIFNTWAVSKAKLIHFLTAEKKKEKNFLKKPVLCAVIFVFACVILGYAYYNVTAGQANLVTEMDVLTQIILGIIGTFLVFWSVSGFFAAAAEKIPGIYRRGLNSFTVGEISNKMNSTVISGTIICLLLFMTICIMSSVVARKYCKDKQAEELAPASVSMWKEMTDKKSVRQVIGDRGISLENFRDITELYTYHTPEITEQEVLGKFLEENYSNYGEAFAKRQVELVKVSDYNKAAQMYHLPEYSLEDDEYMILADAESGIGLYNAGLKKNKEIVIKGKTYYAKYDTCKDGFLMMSYDHYNFGFLLVPDSVQLQEEEIYKNYFIANYENDTRTFRQDMDENVTQYLNLSGQEEPVFTSTQSNIYDNTIGINAVYIFLGLYLSISFLISGAAVMALKMLADAADSKEKYEILRKMGCDEKRIREALWKQNGMFFAFPLAVAAIHSIFGIQVCNFILSIYETDNIMSGIGVSAGLILFIYGGYFLAAQFCSLRVIKG